MTRDEWKAFDHAIRADARAFKESHGGYPCFVRHFMHRGQEWTVTRALGDGIKWHTYTRKSIIRQRSRTALIADELDTAAGHRAAVRGAPWTAYTHKRGARLAVKIAREWRLAA